jgi:hypothetical protein
VCVWVGVQGEEGGWGCGVRRAIRASCDSDTTSNTGHQCDKQDKSRTKAEQEQDKSQTRARRERTIGVLLSTPTWQG